jgi:hypothetical protein
MLRLRSLDYALSVPFPEPLDASSKAALRSDWAIFSGSSNDAEAQIITALSNCFLNFSTLDGACAAGSKLFELNTFEIDREIFKLRQEFELSEITEDRIAADYLEELVFRPLQAAKNLAASDVQAATEEYEGAIMRHEVGDLTIVDVKLAQARLAERQVNAVRADMNLQQRRQEVNAQARRWKAEREDLLKRIELGKLMKDLFSFNAPSNGQVEFFTAAGMFVEEGDPICRFIPN